MRRPPRRTIRVKSDNREKSGTYRVVKVEKKKRKRKR